MAKKSEEAPAPSAAAAQSKSINVPSFNVGVARMYVLEFFILLVHVVLSLALVSGMYSRVLDALAENEPDGFLASLEYETTIGMIAAIIIILPLMGVFFTRVRAAEQKDKKLLSKNWRLIWLNTFLAGVFVWGLSAVVGLVNELVDALLNAGLDDGGEDLWVSISRYLFTAAVAGGAWYFFYETKTKSNAQRDRSFMVGFAAVATALLILTAAFPLADQRNSRIDSFIEQDLADIAQEVDEFVAGENRLPENLAELSLSDAISNRAEEYNYEYSRTSSSSFSAQYELCAVFKTDTSDRELGDQNFGLLDALSGTVPRGFGQGATFMQHTSGRDCFDLTSNSFNPFSSGFEGSSSGSADLESLFESVQ